MQIELRVNGQQHGVDVDADTPLIFVLRNQLRLTAAKLGCAQEQCGACVVMVDGAANYSCVAPVSQFIGKHIQTSEGLVQTPTGQRLRDAFVNHSAAQCGYCTPGIFVALNCLLERSPHPDEQDIRAALQPHLCRCGSHTRVIRAAQEAARST